MNENELLTVEETARCLKISKATVYKMIKKNKLDSVMVNERNLRIPSKCLENILLQDIWRNKLRALRIHSFFDTRTTRLFTILCLYFIEK